MDKFIVRLSSVILTVYMIVATLFALNGIDISEYDFIFTNSFIIGLVLTVLCHSQGKYHCVWMRAMCYNLMFIPIVNFIDSKYPLFETVEGYIYIICISLSITVLSTLILAINHFRKVSRILKLKRQQHESR